jgi:glycosyltransferase involved in cell wall biosynthesis
MKIGYYIHHTTISAGGIFTYSIGILRELIKSNEIEKLVIITSNKVMERVKDFIKNDKIEFKVVDRNSFSTSIRLVIWYLFYFILLIFQSLIIFKVFLDIFKRAIASLNPYQKIITSCDIDILHIPVQYSPIYKTEIPVVITMHDLQEYHFPAYFSLKERLSRKIKNKMAIFDSDHIIVSFNHVKNDIIKFFKVDEEKISVCPPPFAENWFLEKNETEWEETAKKHNLKNKYLLYPAATWQHKNHVKLLEAFKIIRDDGLDYDLVCTGKKTAYYNNALLKKNEELNLSNFVHFLGIVPEEDLISLYKNTSLVVIPTLYEAGSGPLYEAMRYQVPVICSNVTSLPNTVASNDFVFDPTNSGAIAEKIKMGLTNEEFRKINIENSKLRMDYFEKIDYSKNFIGAYKRVSRNFI